MRHLVLEVSHLGLMDRATRSRGTEATRLLRWVWLGGRSVGRGGAGNQKGAELCQHVEGRCPTRHRPRAEARLSDDEAGLAHRESQLVHEIESAERVDQALIVVVDVDLPAAGLQIKDEEPGAAASTGNQGWVTRVPRCF